MAENGIRGPVPVSAGGIDYTTNGHGHNEEHSHVKPLNEAAQKYVQELLAERARMENHFPLAIKLIDEALERVHLNGRIQSREQYADVYQQRTMKLSQKVHVPIKDKKFNYVGKLLGPKGNSLRRLQEETQCKIVILGRFSMKDRVREEELRNSADAKYAHLNLPLHVEVSTIAPPAEAYARVAYALSEIRRYLIPDKHDDIRQEQFRELMEDPEAAKKITIRQQQQQLGSHQSGSGPHSNRPASSGYSVYRPKYQQQSSHHHHNEDTIYYRTHNYQQKPYVPVAQRANSVHSTIAPPAVVGASPSGIVLNATNFGGRAAPIGGNIMTNTALSGSGPTNGNTLSVRYRQPVPFQFVKK